MQRLISQKIMIYVLTIGLLTFFFSPQSSLAEDDLKISYLVDVNEPHTHLFKIKITVDNVGTRYLDFSMPAWMPGYNRILDFARNIQEFQAHDGRQEKLKFEKLDKQTWRVYKSKDRTIELEYKVYANNLQNINIASHIDETHAFFNGAAVFLYVVGAVEKPVELMIKKPEEWKIATGLERLSHYTFKADNYDQLIDCPTEIGTFVEYDFTVEAIPHHIVIYGLGDFDASFIVNDVSKIVRACYDFFGELPYKEYTFIYHLTDRKRRSGVEHANSTAILFNKQDFYAGRKYDEFLTVTAHEFFHLWNIKRIRPQGWGPFDYTKESYTKSHWFTEGITSFYTGIILVRSGLWSRDKFYQDMADKISTFENKPGKKLMSLVEASWNILARPDNLRDATISYYIKGAVVGFMLDCEIRRRTANKKSLDHVLWHLNTHFAQKNKAYREEELLKIINDISQRDFNDFYQKFIAGTIDLPYNDFFRPVGIELTITEEQPVPYLGIETQKTFDNSLRVEHVIPGSPAYESGIDANDIILALNNRRIFFDNWQDFLGQLEIGEVISIALFHRDQMIEKKVKIGKKQKTRFQIREIEAPSLQQQFRDSIFGKKKATTQTNKKNYHHDGLKVTEKVEEFVLQHTISGSDLEIVHKIIEVMHDRFLFVRIDRRKIQSWLKDPKEEEKFYNHLEELKTELRQLEDKKRTDLLSNEEVKRRKKIQQDLYYGEHYLKVFREVIKKKDIYPKDLPFVVSGAEAVEYGISDGCTTATKTFIVLAKAAGIKQIRFVATGCTLNYNRACPEKGQSRNQDVTINGHFFALVKIHGKWALVNCTFLEPYSEDENLRYEIFYELEGKPIDPEMLKQEVLAIPSFQRSDLCHNRLYVIGVGKDSDDDLDVENYNALMNMSVSGDPDHSLCKYDKF